MRIAVVLAVVGFGAVVGCGGKLEGGLDESESGAGGSGDSDESASAGDDVDIWAPKPTGECKGGWDPGEASEDAPCEWYADSECYDTKAYACACICPGGKESVCWSEWATADDSYTVVNCTATED